ncbi:TPA: thiopeptide-type bacteriocin biosynthesis protein [Clostridioides difficile]|uniref:lantibiotic dehydratase n=1 Tax=Clostridioides difficile TaxID=1496 RepID=UPI000939A490|nr:lantibiotic dehydratase [Clostridioides difficile]HBF2788648.1 thiopeptide-type bacteriocin biosynthesis protein [Clostridioides difficile]HBF4062486.1 thiopeptide-type bacteriocin biosynthesis protein [Clostridioides difficile]HBG3259706.1 thiopeptide-type bacteriocin biosynthesis protein [Clostridioides difficile]
MNSVNYKCYDIFMLRTPSLPLDIYLDLDKKYNYNLEQLIENYNLYDFLEENFLITSKNIYHSFKKYTINKECGKAKKIRNYNQSMLKYIIRATSRPTPFGGFSKVGLLEFDSNNKNKEIKICKDSQIKHIDIDNSWLHYVVNIFEKDINVLYQLNLKINSLCYRFGDRFKNPFCSNLAYSDTVKNNHIKYSFLIEYLKSELKVYKSFNELTISILGIYKSIDIDIVKDTIAKLIKSEYILSDLREGLLSKNPLKNLISRLDLLELDEEKITILEKLKEIDLLMISYNNYNDELDIIKNIYSLMESIHKSDTYLMLNTGVKFIHNKVNIEIKRDLEEFINIFKHLYVDKKYLSQNELLSENFQEKYGINIEIPFIEFIDSNGFDAARKFRLVNPNKERLVEREEKIKELIDKKVTLALLNNSEEVIIDENDLDENIMVHSNLNMPTSFDLNVFITKDNEGRYNYSIGPNVGSSEGGTMFQRFEEVFDKHIFKSYRKIYDIKEKLSNNTYITAEIKEINANGRIANILNKTNNYKYFINFGIPSNNSKNEVNIEDLSVGVDNSGLFYIKYKNEKKIKFVLDNMLNPNNTNDIAYILQDISGKYNGDLLHRVFSLSQINKFYIPRIKIGKFTVFPKTWILHSSDFSLESNSEFYLDFKKYLNMFSVDKYVYLKSYDNRLVVNLEKESCLKIIQSELKKNKVLEISEIEKDLFNGSVVTDEYSNKYVSECVFTFLKENLTNLENEGKGERLIAEDRRFNLFSDGWIYLKLYGIGDRTLDILNSIEYELRDNLDENLFFFIRYLDNIGDHLRIRFKFDDKQSSLKNVEKISEWLEKIQNRGMINKAIYDFYERETNRYGGLKLISKAEELFESDSEFVIELLNSFDITDRGELDKICLLGVISSLQILTNNLEELNILLEEFDNLEIRKEFHGQASKYVDFVEKIVNEDLNEFLKKERLLKKYLNRKNKLIEFRELIQSDIPKKSIDELRSVFLSISHMFCNRLYGNRSFEDRILSLSYLSINRILHEFKYRK